MSVHSVTTLLVEPRRTQPSDPHHAAQLHAGLLVAGSLLTDPLLLTQLVSLYAASGRVRTALLAFRAHLPHTNLFTYTALISRLARPHPLLAFSLFSHALRSSCGLRPNPHAVSAVLAACAHLRSSHGRQVHAFAEKIVPPGDAFVSTGLVDAYAKCGDIAAATKVFDGMPHQGIVSWNALIVGYVKNGMCLEALGAFRELVTLNLEVPLDEVSLLGALSACAGGGDVIFGRQVHAHVVKVGLGVGVACVNNALLDMYTKCGCSQEALKLFDAARSRDVITWNIVILGCLHDKRFEEACLQFRSMIREGVRPDDVSFATALHVSACLAARALGANIHAFVVKTGFLHSQDLASSLITMYSKCGCLDDACRAFEATKEHLCVMAWTAMITALQQHGHGGRAVELFETMLEKGIVPDHVTFVSVLSACSHNGLVEQGRRYFDLMRQVHKITPWSEHYACMVDMLGRAGLLSEAKQFIEEMPVKPDACVLGALLGACMNCRDLELGREVAKKLFEVEPGNTGNYVLLANIYAAHGRLEEAKEVRRCMSSRDVRKEKACSWIDIESNTYVFSGHPQQSHSSRTDESYMILGMLDEQMRLEGSSSY